MNNEFVGSMFDILCSLFQQFHPNIVIHYYIIFYGRFFSNAFEVKTIFLKGFHDPTIDAEVLERMSAQQILSLLQLLPATTRAVFNLYITEGYNHREIGEILNISEGTSKWHLSEARKYLINSLKAKERACLVSMRW